MADKVAGQPSLKERALHELKVYWIITLYFALFLGAFTVYRRLILSEAGVSYLTYGFKLVEALIVAKLILIGEAVKLGKRFEGQPLIVSVLVKSILFALFVALFTIIEHIVEALIHKQDWRHVLGERAPDEIMAHALVLMVTLIPLFCFLEVGRVLGPGRLSAMFFSRSYPDQSASVH